MKNEVAKTILSQLGGNRFLAMTGAHSLTVSANALEIKLPKNPAKVYGLKIELAADDTYSMLIGTQKPHFVFTWEKIEGIYCDNLVSIFEEKTGLAARL